jgi:3-oxoadipate enol-lactonase
MISGQDTIHFEVYGDAPETERPPLLMVMGLSGVIADWGDLPRALATGRKVAVFDHRGMGQSKTNGELTFTFDEQVDLVFELADYLGWRRFVLLGLSMGGMIAQACYLKRPERITALILLSTRRTGLAITPPKVDLVEMLSRQYATRRDAGESFVKANLSDAEVAKLDRARLEQLIDQNINARRPVRAIMQQMKSIGQCTGVTTVDRKYPVLVIHGDGDNIIDVSEGRDLATTWKASTYAELKGRGHMTYCLPDGLLETVHAIAKFLSPAQARL